MSLDPVSYAMGYKTAEAAAPAPASLLAVENGNFTAPAGTAYTAVTVNVPTMAAHRWTGATLSDVNDVSIRAALPQSGEAVCGTWEGTLSVGGSTTTQALPVTARNVNGTLVLTGGASDGSQGCLFLLTGSGGGGLAAQQLYLIQSGTLTDLTAYGGQIISNVTIRLIY